jgi:hypothetical protein
LPQVLSRLWRTPNKELKSKGKQNNQKEQQKSAKTQKGDEGNALGKENHDLGKGGNTENQLWGAFLYVLLTVNPI